MARMSLRGVALMLCADSRLGSAGFIAEGAFGAIEGALVFLPFLVR